MKRSNTLAFTAVAMIAFASNSLLCRAALHDASIDPATFAFVRTLTAALTLAGWLVIQGRPRPRFSGPIVIALAVYMAPFTFAYLDLTTGVGALLLFGFAQLTMVGTGIVAGERPTARVWLGIGLAIAGLVFLVAMSETEATTIAALAMGVAGIAWGAFSLAGRAAADPIEATAASFFYALPLIAAYTVPFAEFTTLTSRGFWLAAVSGIVTSGIGYVVWFTAMRQLARTEAGTAQLSIPILAALGGTILLAEPLGSVLIFASIATLGGIALVLRPAASN